MLFYHLPTIPIPIFYKMVIASFVSIASNNLIQCEFLKRYPSYYPLHSQPFRNTKMQDNLNIITEFGNKVSEIIKVFADLCRDYKRRQDNPLPEFEEMQDQLIKKRKQRMELEDLVRQKMAASNQTDTSLNEIMGNQEERKRPKTAFALFLADQRNKMLKESPTLSLQKVTGLATIKWRKLSKQQQQIYVRKLQEMNKIHESEANQYQTSSGNDHYLVKKQHLVDGNERIEEEYHDESEERKDDEEEEKENSNENYLAATAEVNNTQYEPEGNEQEHNQEGNGTIDMLMDLFPRQNHERYQRNEHVIAALASHEAQNIPFNEHMSPKANSGLPMVDQLSLQAVQTPPTIQQ